MQRCVPGSVQSFSPDVPSAQPSQTPSLRIRQANGSWSRFSQATLSISQVVMGLLLAESEEGHGLSGSIRPAAAPNHAAARVTVA